MIDVILVFFLLLIFNKIILKQLANRFDFFDEGLMNKLYLYHCLFFLIYFVYSFTNSSDSYTYYLVANNIGDEWMSLNQTGSKFIAWIITPIVELGLSFLSVMLIFSWAGYIGFVYAYIFFKENIPMNITVFGKFDLLTLLLFFPNMHFWTVSLGKGSLIFMGLMLFIHAIGSPKKRILLILIGGYFVYMVRPHVMLFLLLGVMLGILTGKSKMGGGVKFIVIIASVVFLLAAKSSILGVAKLQNSENVIEDFQTFADGSLNRSESSANSSVSMGNYPLPIKLFTLWFRPLFVDSPGGLGIFSSVENLIYLLLFAKIFNKRFLRFIIRAPDIVKTAAIVFLLTSFALTFVMSNLGILMRQKSMVMYFGFFVIYYFLAQEKWEEIQLEESFKASRAKLILDEN